MRAFLPASLAILLVIARPAGAAEFLPSWTAEGVWSSNVFRSLDENQFGVRIPKEDDFSLRTGPDVRLREAQGDFKYDVSYRLRYEEYARLDGVSNFDHFARGRADWAITDRTSVYASDDFGYTESLSGLFDTFGDAVDPVVRPARQRLTTNSANGGVRHRLGPLWELDLSGTHQYVDYGNESGSQSVAASGSAQLTRGVTRRMVLGFGAQAQRQESSDDVGSVDSGSTFLQVFGLANYQISPTWRISFSAGPALSMPDGIDTDTVTEPSFIPVDVASCPARPDGVRFVPQGQAVGFQIDGPQCNPLIFIDQNSGQTFFPFRSSQTVDVPFVGESGVEDSITYFARVQLEKRWHLWRLTGGYSRSASNASGLGTSTLVDNFNTSLFWTPSRRWTITLTGSLTMQSAISEARAQEVAVREGPGFVNATTATGQVASFFLPCTVLDPRCVAIPFEVSSGEKIDNPIDIQTYRFELRGERHFGRNISTTAAASWYQQTNSGVFADNRRSEYRVVVGFTWRFDPIPL